MVRQATTVPNSTTGSIAERLFFRGDPGYEEVRVGRIWHARVPDRFPDAVLMAETEADLVEAVRLARSRGWQISVRAGGHSFPVWSVREGGLMVDTGGFREMTYDPESGIATATPAIQGGHELNPFLSKHGRFFGGGGCPSVGVGGFLLQGGIGWNFRNWGYACEQLTAIDMVTAEGDLVHADETQNSDLYWAARGIGPGFCGLITRFHIRTRKLPTGIGLSMQAYPVKRYADILRWFWDKENEIAESVYINALSVRPPMPVPGHDGGLVFLIWGLAFCDDIEEARRALAPFRECPFLNEAILAADAQPTTMPEQYGLLHNMHPEGLRYRVDSAWVEGDREATIAAIRPLVVDRLPEDVGYTFLIFKQPRPDAPDMAAAMETDLMVGAYSIYDSEADDESMRTWLHDAMSRLQGLTAGQYWGDSDQQNREVKCLTDESWSRFQEIRRRHDPDGVFALHLSGKGGFRNRNHWEDKLSVPAMDGAFSGSALETSSSGSAPRAAISQA